uniref:Peptidase M16 N-terminal domain-containing protein n=1 Tax=Lotharella globosa TaxID=91324 RepID=A0A7S3YW74_9EUKA
MRKGQIAKNGFRYIILNNPVPAGRFEAHLQMHVGSIEEGDDEQGVAHIVEHVTFLGSDKRSVLFGTGSESNAYTDFHHTVYHINCPLVSQGTTALPPNTKLLPLALDALREIAFEAKMLNSRIEKERLAVLSELSMMTNMEYRMTTQEICELHSETILPKRFPIGDEATIRKVHPDKVRAFYHRFYHSDRADLFIVGDVDLDETEALIKKVFEPVPPSPTYLARQAMKVGALAGLKDYNETFSKFPEFDPRNDWRIRPQVKHRFSDENRVNFSLDPAIFRHEMIPSLQLVMCAKLPVQPIQTKKDLREFVLSRLVVACLGWSLTSKVRPNPPLSGIEFDHSDSMSESCAVTTLKLYSRPHEWQDMLSVAMKDVRRAYRRGFSQAELDCMITSILADSRQAAQQAGNIPSSEIVGSLLEAELLGHTFMDFNYYHSLLEEIVETITLEDVNEHAKKLLEYIAEYGEDDAPLPAAILACVPSGPNGEKDVVEISKEDIQRELQHKPDDDEYEDEVENLEHLVSPEALAHMHTLNPPAWVDVEPGVQRKEDPKTGIVMRRLSNGIRVNIKKTLNSPNTVSIAAVSPGGLARETRTNPAAVKLGVQAIMQGGSFGNYSREMVDLFSMRKLMNINFGVTLESITWDLLAPTETVDDLMQFLMLTYSDLRWNEKAFNSAKDLFQSNWDAVTKSLEMASADMLVRAVANDDARFWGPPPEVIESLDLNTVKDELEKQLCTDGLEINIVGDFDMEEIEESVLKHLGTIPKRDKPEPIYQQDIIDIKPDPTRQHQRIELPDDQKRAIGYLTGVAPNRWGYSTENPKCKENGYWSYDGKVAKDEQTQERRKHPMFATACIELIEKMVSTELYSLLRDSLSLVYHTKFEVGVNERLPTNDWLIVINSEHQNVDRAVNEASKCLRNIRFTPHMLSSAKRSVQHFHETESANDAYWLGYLRGMQDDTIPDKMEGASAEYYDVLNQVSLDDIKEVWKTFLTSEKDVYTCVGVSG